MPGVGNQWSLLSSRAGPVDGSYGGGTSSAKGVVSEVMNTLSQRYTGRSCLFTPLGGRSQTVQGTASVSGGCHG